ncbi:zinc knuckle, partial [Cooperia oncophora]
MADVPSAVDEVDLDPREESNDVPMAVDDVDVDHREELNELKRQLEMARRELDLIRSQKNEPNKGGTKDGYQAGRDKQPRSRRLTASEYRRFSGKTPRRPGESLTLLSEGEVSENESCVSEALSRRSEALSRRSSQESSSLVENQLGAYLKYVALPEVRTFELRTGLTKRIGSGISGGLQAQTSRVVALGKLRRSRKSDEQSVAEYCVQLERLSAIAYPELDEGALMTARAQQLYEQVVHWPESVYFLEAMETSGKDAYNNLKEAVLRVERRKLMVECTKDQHEQETETKRRNIKYSRSFRSGSDGAALRKTDRREANSDMREKVTGPTDQSESRVRPIKGQIQCFNCKGRGHMARDCKKGNDVGSKATDVETSTARCTKDMTGQQSGVVSPFGEKSTTKVTIFGKVWPALLDTGSEISILPLKVLQQIESKGRRLREYPVDQNKKILDASGNPMKFRKIVEVPLKEGSEGEIILQMHVSVEKGHLLVLGTNALQALNYTLVRLPNGEDRQEKANVVRGVDKATVCRRAYVAPGELKWVTIKGGARDTERLQVDSFGLCVVDEVGVAKIPVWTEPLVLKVSQEVGAWEENEVEYSKVIATEVPTDMLVLGKPTLQAEERKQVLNEYLRSNREIGASDEPELWKLID